MRRREPPGITGHYTTHIPADLYQQTGGRPVVILQTTPARRPAGTYLVPLGIGLAAAIGVMGCIAAALALFEFAVQTAALIGGGPIGLGLALKLFRPKTK
ncbi:hypothetical protein [Streptomyces albus]|uniref:hypothetical protein n=1 Tax=Streptomyces albus TaxID=1888 RepID=UPI0004C61BFE|nr:hypothetical protein [Streptomyces albus]